MKSIKNTKKIGLIILLVICLCLVFSGSAMAAAPTNADLVKAYIEEYYIFDYDRSILQSNDIDKIIEGLHDPYAEYYTPEEFAEFMHDFNKDGYGLGINYSLLEKGQGVFINNVMKDSAAEAAGLKAGDIITEINGVSIINKTLTEIKPLFPTTEGVNVNLKYIRDGKTNNLSIITAAYDLTPAYGVLGDDMGYISISYFNENLPKYMGEIIAEFKEAGVKSLILDLSNSPGGDVQIMSDVLDMLIPFGKTAFLDMANGRFKTYWTYDQEYWDIPIVVLVNNNTWSAAEIFATTMQDLGVPVIGSKTGGKGVAQSLFMLPDGAIVKFTTARSYSRNMQDIYTQKGVLPSIYVGNENKAADLAVNMLLNKTSNMTYTGKIGSKELVFLNEHLEDTITMLKAPKLINDKIYLSLRDAAYIAGYNVSLKNGGIVMQGYDDKIIINPVTNMVKKSGKATKENLVKNNGTTMVSETFIKKYFGFNIEIYTDYASIIIKNYD